LPRLRDPSPFQADGAAHFIRNHQALFPRAAVGIHVTKSSEDFLLASLTSCWMANHFLLSLVTARSASA
jgi:hypothetical protein